MKSATARLLAAALVIMVAPLSVRAEPVTFNYKVSVTHRCKATGIDCVPYFSSFPLTMTFDGEVIEAHPTYIHLDAAPLRSGDVFGRPAAASERASGCQRRSLHGRVRLLGWARVGVFSECTASEVCARERQLLLSVVHWPIFGDRLLDGPA